MQCIVYTSAERGVAVAVRLACAPVAGGVHILHACSPPDSPLGLQQLQSSQKHLPVEAFKFCYAESTAACLFVVTTGVSTLVLLVLLGNPHIHAVMMQGDMQAPLPPPPLFCHHPKRQSQSRSAAAPVPATSGPVVSSSSSITLSVTPKVAAQSAIAAATSGRRRHSTRQRDLVVPGASSHSAEPAAAHAPGVVNHRQVESCTMGRASAHETRQAGNTCGCKRVPCTAKTTPAPLMLWSTCSDEVVQECSCGVGGQVTCAQCRQQLQWCQWRFGTQGQGSIICPAAPSLELNAAPYG